MGTSNFPINIVGQVTGSADMEKAAAAMERLAASIDKAGAKTESVNPQFDKFAKSVGDFIRNPLQAAGDQAEAFLKKIGPMGAAIGASATILGVFGAAAARAMRDLGNFGDQIEDMSIRTGLTVKEVGELSFAMKRAGGDVSVAERAIFEMTRSLAETGAQGDKARKVLKDMRIDFGSATPGQLIQSVADGLAKMQDTGERNVATMALFRKAGRELLPDLLELGEGINRARQLGIAPTETEIKRWTDYQKQIAEVDAIWDSLVRKAKQPIAAVLSVTLQAAEPVLRLLMLATPAGVYNAGVTRGEQERAQTGWSESRALHRLVTQSIAGGRSMIAGDVATRGRTKTGLQDLLKSSEAAASEAWDAYVLSAGQTGDIVRKKREEWERASAAAAKYRHQLEAITKAEQALKSLESFESRMTEKGLLPVEKIFRERDELIKSGVSPSRATSAAIIGASSELAKQEKEMADQRRDLMFKGLQRYAKGGVVGFGDQSELSWESVSKGLDIFNERVLKGVTEAARVQTESSKLALDHQTRMIELLTGPGGEVAAITQVANLRLASAKTALEQQAALNQMEEQLAALQKARVDAYVGAVQGGFRALVSGGRGGLSSFIQSQFMGIGEQVAGNFARLSYSTVQKFMPHVAEGSTLGKLLAGTPFGPNPLDRAGTKLDIAGDKLIMAAAALSSRGIAGGIGGTLGGLSSSGSSLFSAFQTGGYQNVSDLPLTNPSGQWLGAFAPEGTSGSWPQYSGGTSGGGSRSGAAIGYATAGAAATFSAIRMFKAPSAKGKVSAAGDTAMSVGSMLPPPAGPAVMAAGLAMKVFSAIMGDPKQIRAKQLQDEAAARAFTEPLGTSITADIWGNSMGYDAWNRSRPMIVNNFSVKALDGASVLHVLKSNPAEVAAGLTHAVATGNAEDFVGTMRPLMN